jgi:hypothetical protein
MIEDNKTVRQIMTFSEFEWKKEITIINEKLKQMFISLHTDGLLLDGLLPDPNSQFYVIDIMTFHAIFKQYMVKQQDSIKENCNCKDT